MTSHTQSRQKPNAPMMMSCFVGNGASLGSGGMASSNIDLLRVWPRSSSSERRLRMGGMLEVEGSRIFYG
jgi:hypothetical protein